MKADEEMGSDEYIKFSPQVFYGHDILSQQQKP